MENIKITKGSVQETLLIPLYGRKVAMDMYPDIFNDKECQKLFDQLEYTFDAKGIKAKIGAIMSATRQYDMASICKKYLREHPNACVVNMGCGLDTTFYQVDNGTCKGYNLDFEDTMEIRNKLLPPKDREFNIVCDLNDISWFKQIDFKEEDGAVFFASGVFYYFKSEDVKKLFISMSNYFKGACLAYDATNAKGLKNMLKTWLEPSQMGEIGVYFSVESAEDLKAWSPTFKEVKQNKYLTGYHPLDKRYGFIINTLFKYLDNHKMCQVIEMKF